MNTLIPILIFVLINMIFMHSLHFFLVVHLGLYTRTYTQSDRMPLVLQCPSPPYTNVCHCYSSLLLSFTPPPRSSMLQQEEVDEEEGESRAKKRGIQHRPGDRWMLRGPIEYVPPATVEVLLRRDAIPLDENEGIYVRDIKTGKARFEDYKESIEQMDSLHFLRFSESHLSV